MCNAGNKIRDMPTTKCKIEFSKFCKVYARQNQKTNLVHLHIHLKENYTFLYFALSDLE